jgi:hypothetical protein
MLRGTAWIFALAPVVVACSSSDDTSSPPPVPVVYDAGGGAKAEAGAACATSNDCAAGLACLYPKGACDVFRECSPAPPSSCSQATTVCSCLGHTLQLCGDRADEPIDHDGPCADSGTIVPVDSGGDQAAPPLDASDAATE